MASLPHQLFMQTNCVEGLGLTVRQLLLTKRYSPLRCLARRPPPSSPP